MTYRPFVPNWADAEQAGLNRVRRDNAMRWLVDKGMLERDEEAENRLGTEEGFRITISVRRSRSPILGGSGWRDPAEKGAAISTAS